MPNGGGKSMGLFAEDCASKYHFTREAQDAYALESSRRARTANEDGSFAWETVPVTIPGRKGDVVVERDESPFKVDPSKIPNLHPTFVKDGTITAPIPFTSYFDKTPNWPEATLMILKRRRIHVPKAVDQKSDRRDNDHTPTPS